MTDTPMTPDRPVCTQEAARTAGLDVAPSPDELRAVSESVVSLWGDRWAEPDDQVASIADSGAQLARAMPLVLAEVDRLRKALSDAADQVAELDDELGKASAHTHFLERNTLPDLHRQIEHHKGGKARWRKRAETAEARVAQLQAERDAVLALHRKHTDSDHCFADDETWPCQTRTALDSPDAGTPRPTGLPLGLTGRARHEARVAIETARRMRRRPGACFTCGDVPDEWCPDCACCKAGCDGGRTNNPCTHPNAPWNTELTS